MPPKSRTQMRMPLFYENTMAPTRHSCDISATNAESKALRQPLHCPRTPDLFHGDTPNQRCPDQKQALR